MSLKRHQQFWLETEIKWTEKWFKFMTSQDGENLNVIPNNPNITMDLIEAHPEYPWNWREVSRNPNLTMELIEAHPEYPWNWRGVSKNPNLTMDFIEAHPEYDWDWLEVEKNKFTKNKELFMIEEARKYMAIYKIKIQI